MALEGFKYWADGEPVVGTDANAFLMSQSVMRFENASDRDSALARTLATGMVAYLKDTTTLQIYDGSAWVDVALGSAGSTDHGALTGLGDDDHTQYLLADGTRTATELAVSGDLTVDTDTLHVDSTNDRVGIGTTSPSQTLEVDGTAHVGSLATTDGTTNSRGILASHQNNINYSFVGRSEGGVADTGNRLGWDYDDDSFNIKTGGATRMTIDSSGNVGIGTTSPSATLDVDGETQASYVTLDRGGISLPQPAVDVEANGVGAGDYNYFFRVWNDTGAKAIMFVNGSTRSADGGANTMTIRNDGGGSIFGNASYLTTVTGSNVYLPGNVGVNQTNPSQKLQVTAGMIQLDSLYGIRWSNGDSLIYDDGSNQYQFTGDGDTDLVCDGFLSFDSGIVLSNSDANYGSAEIDGYSRGGYYGLNLNNGANFMYNGSAMGIYNDAENEWIMYGVRNSEAYMFYNGGVRVTCRSDGVTNAGRIITDGIAYNHNNCGGSANSMALRWSSPYIKGSVDNVVCATLGTVSDERFKKDIASWDGGIDILRQLRTVTYTPRDITAWGEVSLEPIEGYEPREPKHGLIAQEVIEVMPTAVDGASTESGYLSLNEDELIAMLISAVQNIDNRVTALGA